MPVRTAQVRETAAGVGPAGWALLAVGTAGLARGAEVVAGGGTRTGVLAASTAVALLLGALAYRRATAARVARPPEARRLGLAVLVGGLGGLAVQAGAHALQVLALALTGRSTTVVVTGINPATGTGRHLATYLVVGVLLAALAEELLFRGAVRRAAVHRWGGRRGNAVQAGLFGLWHLAWPLALALGPLDPPVALPVLAVGTVLVTGVVGAIFGVLVRATGTLWTPILAHVVHNGVAVFVHVRAGGTDRAGVLAPALIVGYVALAVAAARLDRPSDDRGR